MLSHDGGDGPSKESKAGSPTIAGADCQHRALTAQSAPNIRAVAGSRRATHAPPTRVQPRATHVASATLARAAVPNATPSRQALPRDRPSAYESYESLTPQGVTDWVRAVDWNLGNYNDTDTCVI